MIRRPYTFFLAACLAICWAWTIHAQQIEAYFSPRGGTLTAIICRINDATTSIDVAAYQFTHPDVAAALLAASRRRVTIRLLLDRSQEYSPHTKAPLLHAAGVQARTDGYESIMHNKTMVIDSTIVITGSFNFTRSAADKNAENCLLISDPKLATQYAADFARHWAHSRPYVYRRSTATTSNR